MAPSKRGAGDEKILSYNDVVLRRSDLDILRGPHFINDRLIDLHFAHLSATAAASILFIPPSLSFLISNLSDPDSLREILAPLRLPERDLILFTVNDNTDPSVPEAGSHWSLLAFHRRAGEFVHHDSSRGLNRWDAERLYRAVRDLVGSGGGGGDALFVERATPRQTNGYDCGLHVMAAARAICGWHESGGADGEGWSAALEEEAAKVGVMRGELLNLIADLMELQKSE